MSVEDGSPGPPEQLLAIELDLRRIVGVVSARVERSPEGQGLAVALAVVGSKAGVADAARAAVRPWFEGVVDVDVTEVAPPGPPPVDARPGERVRLIGIHAWPEVPLVEVRLGHGERQAVGRSADRRLIGAARASLAALRSLGADLPFEIEAITNLGPGGTGPVLVRLSGVDSGPTRLGVVAAEDGYHATVRALLHALNRHLERAFSEDGRTSGPAPSDLRVPA